MLLILLSIDIIPVILGKSSSKIKMQKINRIFYIILAVGLLFFSVAQADEQALSQREIADSVKPGVVKIVQHVQGSAVIPVIAIDFKTMAVTTDTSKSPQNIQINEYLTGSGIVVTPDGYIMTNSHIVSYQTVKNLIVSDFIAQAIDDGFAKLSEDEAKEISARVKPEDMAAFSEKIANYILEQSQFDLTKTVTVLNPSSPTGTLDDLASKGFNATVISVNDNFFKDSRDAALIKIEQSNLPAVALGNSTDDFTGKRVFILGYPSTAEINEKDLLAASFSQGTISATKDSPQHDFQILQTDAKISKGSSGGPLLDEQGRVIGLVTFITNDTNKQDGDSFAFAIPIDAVKEIISRNMIEEKIPRYQVGDFYTQFTQGIYQLNNKHCQIANKDFDKAKLTNNAFLSPRLVDPYIKQCEGIIAAGESVDSGWDTLKSFFIGLNLYFAVGVIIAGLIFLAAFARVFRRMKRDEAELDNIEEHFHLDLNTGEPEDKEDTAAVFNDVPDNLKPKIH
jgi:S1-C subfamily serine protease